VSVCEFQRYHNQLVGYRIASRRASVPNRGPQSRLHGAPPTQGDPVDLMQSRHQTINRTTLAEAAPSDIGRTLYFPILPKRSLAPDFSHIDQDRTPDDPHSSLKSMCYGLSISQKETVCFGPRSVNHAATADRYSE
jgi:hypothetical protein